MTSQSYQEMGASDSMNTSKHHIAYQCYIFYTSLFLYFFLFKTLKLLQTLNNYINKIRNNLWVTKTKMCVARYTNKIWAQKCFNTIKSYYINNNIMKQSNHIDIMLIIISKFVFVYDEKTKTKP